MCPSSAPRRRILSSVPTSRWSARRYKRVSTLYIYIYGTHTLSRIYLLVGASGGNINVSGDVAKEQQLKADTPLIRLTMQWPSLQSHSLQKPSLEYRIRVISLPPGSEENSARAKNLLGHGYHVSTSVHECNVRYTLSVSD